MFVDDNNENDKSDNPEQKEENSIDESREKEDENTNDVILDIPSLKAESLKMDAENIKFSISIKAQLSNFSNIEIGTNIHIEKIKLDIDSLEAEAFFTVKLKKIETIFLNALQSIDKNPQIINIKNNDEQAEKS